MAKSRWEYQKVIDYILVEIYVQSFTKECSVDRQLNFGTDHNLLYAKHQHQKMLENISVSLNQYTQKS